MKHFFLILFLFTATLASGQSLVSAKDKEIYQLVLKKYYSDNLYPKYITISKSLLLSLKKNSAKREESDSIFRESKWDFLSQIDTSVFRHNVLHLKSNSVFSRTEYSKASWQHGSILSPVIYSPDSSFALVVFINLTRQSKKDQGELTNEVYFFFEKKDSKWIISKTVLTAIY